MLHGDTGLLAWGLGTFASRGLSVAGSAVFKGGSVSNPGVYGENIAAIRAAAEDALKTG